MNEAWDCTKLIDSQKLWSFLLLFHEIDDFGFKLDASDFEESQCRSTGLTDGIKVKSDRHIFDRIS